MAENFFRRWPLYVLPLVLLAGLGVVEARKTVADYRSIGVVNVVSNPLLPDVSGIPSTNNNFQTPAGATAQAINELLGTAEFVQSVAKGAGLDGDLQTGKLTVLDIRSRVFAGASGIQLLAVTATWPTAETAQRLASSTITSYVNYVVNQQIAKTTDASKFWAARETTYQAKLDAANKALSTFLARYPKPVNGDRTAQQQVQLDALTADVTAAQAQVTNAQTQQEQDDLTTQELRTAATQGLQIVDPPQVPLAPDSIKKKEALTLGVFVVLGLIVAGSLLLISTLLDRTVRSAEDIDAASGLAVIATVPYVSALRPSRKTRRQQTGRKRAAAAA